MSAAKVIAIVPTSDRQKATVRVRVGFDQLDPRILPDMGLKVAFQSNEAPAAASRALVVPQAAQQQRHAHHAVQHDHHHREHGVARHRGVALAGEHHRRDHHHLHLLHLLEQH